MILKNPAFIVNFTKYKRAGDLAFTLGAGVFYGRK